MARRKVLGTLALLWDRDEPEFDAGIVERARVLADLASIALQRLLALSESERRRVQAESAVRARDDMLSIVSHDLRNPVSTIAMSASLLSDPQYALSGDEQQKQLGVIARSAHRMNRLIQDLLDVARIEGRRLTVSCRCEQAEALAREACESFQGIVADKGLTLTCDVDDGIPPVYVYRDRVLQLLSNFLNNAVKFSPEAGAIEITARRQRDGGVRFGVTDHGRGIRREDLPNVFKRYWQAQKTAHLGSGLGLTIAHGIAEAHGGRVWVESETDVATTFYFELGPSKQCP
jgi:signal transduction histidine kinase